MGNTCTPMVDSCQCMAKPIQYCKGKKTNLKNNNKNMFPEPKSSLTRGVTAGPNQRHSSVVAA